MADIPVQLQASSAPMNGAMMLQEKIVKLREALTTAHPLMPVLLREIWMALKKDEELTYLLSEEDIATIVDGLEKQSQVEIVKEVVKAKPKVSLKNMTLGDL